MNASVELTVYEWHILIGILEHRMSFANLDKRQAESIWRKICENLNIGESSPDWKMEYEKLRKEFSEFVERANENGYIEA